MTSYFDEEHQEPEVDVPNQPEPVADFWDDILTTAEYQSIDYWARIVGSAPGVLRLTDIHDGKSYKVQSHQLFQAWTSLLHHRGPQVNSGHVDRMTRAFYADDAGVCDVYESDILVQIVCFGKIVYG